MGSNITSEEINYLIYRYLQEAGFLHASFAFGHESLVYKSGLKAEAVPPGTLVTLLQKGSHYVEIETHLSEDGTVRACDKPFHLLEPHVCGALLEQEVSQVQIQGEREQGEESGWMKRKEENNHKKKMTTEKRKRESEKEKEKIEKELNHREKEKDQREIGLEKEKEFHSHSHPSHFESISHRDILESEVRTFARHSREVFVCSWHPKKPVLASAAGDGLAFIWDTRDGDASAILLDHTNGQSGATSSNSGSMVDITTLDWHVMGSYLATGAYDGVARIWNERGELVHTLRKHKEPIFSLKWNKRGNYLLTGSFDKTTIVWDASTGEARQVWDVHAGPILDADWKNNTTFASCSSDKSIHVCKLNEKRPLKTLTGHTEDINAVKWDPSAVYLASGSDDKTAKIWDMNHDGPIHDLIGHEKDVYTLEWSPTGPKSDNPNMDVYLATASFDHTAKLWQLETGQCTATLARHSYPVYSIAYSPNAQYIATGSFDKTVHIWSAKEGRPIRTFTGSSGVFDVCWNATGDQLAVSTDHHKVHVIDFRY